MWVTGRNKEKRGGQGKFHGSFQRYLQKRLIYNFKLHPCGGLLHIGRIDLGFVFCLLFPAPQLQTFASVDETVRLDSKLIDKTP